MITLNGGYIGGLNDEILLIGSKNLELMKCDYMHYESAKVPDRILTKEDLVTYVTVMEPTASTLLVTQV